MKHKIVQLILFSGVVLLLPRASHAAFLEFDPEKVSVAVGATTEVKVNINAESAEILSTDVRITYDPKFLSVDSIENGDYFSIAKTDSTTPGKIYIAGIVDEPGQTQTGAGVLATVIFKGVANGTTSVQYVCTPGETARDSNIANNELNVADIIECQKNGTSDIVVGTGGSGTSGGGTSGSSGPTPSVLPQSGVMDGIYHFAIPGTILLLVGLGLKLLL